MKSALKNELGSRSSYGEIIGQYINNLESLKEGLYDAMKEITSQAKNAESEFEAFVKEKKIRKMKSGSGTTFAVTGKNVDEFEKLHEKKHRKDKAYLLTPKSFIASFVSQFEIFLRILLKETFRIKPDLINSSGKQVDILRLRGAASLTDLMDEIVNEEIDKIVRSNPKDLSNWFQSRLSIEINKLNTWPLFVETKLRRNLFIHTDGIVNNEYIKACKENGISLHPSLKLGFALDASPDYFSHAYHVLFEFGLLIGQCVWRKLDSNELSQADDYLSEEIVDLINNSHYALTVRILDFILNEMKSYSSEESRLVMTINLALAYKKMSDKKTMKKIIDSIDWSASNDIFLLAIAVLNDDEGGAYRFLTRAIDNNEISKHALKKWPLFDELRKKHKFGLFYKRKFHEKLDLRTINMHDHSH